MFFLFFCFCFRSLSIASSVGSRPQSRKSSGRTNPSGGRASLSFRPPNEAVTALRTRHMSEAKAAGPLRPVHPLASSYPEAEEAGLRLKSVIKNGAVRTMSAASVPALHEASADNGGVAARGDVAARGGVAARGDVAAESGNAQRRRPNSAVAVRRKMAVTQNRPKSGTA